ncbi:flagellar filament capping protein FliD [Anaerobium acetethylicum]|uniref:Flagellar hook-associated protein 2 n=1 Tax=Anaerobium acetethylicum TaxID=1619234 RepID=A0A1D3TUT1_9FIRM|nr:flagellar filament capping protein FliD [Anaerobium acetethylicum]SCP97815.1 flagellar hook-associated protein 2 [Anaerobium acetethylicum]
MSIRMSGMVSGMDTDSIVKELVSAYSTKKTNLEKAQTKLEWKQDAWKELNSKIYKLYSGKLSAMRRDSGYSMKMASVSDETKASVTAGNGVPVGTQTLEVESLAKSGYLTGGVLTPASGTVSSSTTLGELGIAADTSFTIKAGDGAETAIELKSGTTVAELLTSIRATGVNASFDSTNQRLFISSKLSGEANNFTISAAGADAAAIAASTAALENLGLNAAGGGFKVEGTDASILLNGAEFTSQTNSFNINGLTITAKAETAAGQAVSINTATDTEGIYKGIKDFLTEYNTLVNEMDSLYNADSARGYEPLSDEEKEAMTDDQIATWEKKIKDALLRKDSTLGTVGSTMKNAMAQTVELDGVSHSLSEFGIKTLGYFASDENERGAYHIDGDKDDSATSGNEDKLKAAIAADPDGVIGFFKGLATNLYDKLDAKMKSTSLNSTYKIYSDKKMAADYLEYEDKLEQWDEKIADMEDYYYNRFSAMEKALSDLEASSSSLASLLGS